MQKGVKIQVKQQNSCILIAFNIKISAISSPILLNKEYLTNIFNTLQATVKMVKSLFMRAIFLRTTRKCSKKFCFMAAKCVHRIDFNFFSKKANTIQLYTESHCNTQNRSETKYVNLRKQNCISTRLNQTGNAPFQYIYVERTLFCSCLYGEPPPELLKVVMFYTPCSMIILASYEPFTKFNKTAIKTVH